MTDIDDGIGIFVQKKGRTSQFWKYFNNTSVSLGKRRSFGP